MGPIEHAVCQIAFKIEKKYQDNEFKEQVLSIASSIHSGRPRRKLITNEAGVQEFIKI